ncbi:resolvase [Microbacterium nanhaiense]|uniref:Resolvase n=1 Tax=Microbacterium nanhaiense TaxID=1301026 RepID=A0ABQ2MZY5_9MICO|nr:resolvase [Microbacterium nanhaiense]
MYARISDDREGQALGVERQVHDCEALADRLGFVVVDRFLDNDIGASELSSRRKVRTAYQDMLQRATTGEFKHILAYSNSRLTRRVREYLDLIDLYKQHKVTIHTVVSGDHDLATADGRAVALTLATWDAAEAERISERIRRANLQKAMKGEPGVQHRRAFGFEQDARTHKPNEVALIREAVKDIIGGASITSIRRKWESLGVLTVEGKAAWGWTPVYRSLFSWKTAGVRSHNGEPLYDADGNMVMGNWEAIISLEERAAGIAMLEKRSRRGVKEGRWLLSDLLRCGICGGKLYGQRMEPEERSTYGCNSGTTANHIGVSARRLEELVAQEVFNYLVAKTFRGVEAPTLTNQPWPDEGKLSALDDRIAELMAAHGAGILSSEVVFPQIQKLEEERSQLRKERDDHYLTQQAAPANRLESVWTHTAALNRSDALFEDKQSAIRSEVEAVFIEKAAKGPGSRSEEAFRKRIRIVWKQPHPEVEPLTDEDWANLKLTAADDPAMIARLWSLFTEETD